MGLTERIPVFQPRAPNLDAHHYFSPFPSLYCLLSSLPPLLTFCSHTPTSKTYYTTLNEEQQKSYFGDFYSFTSFQSYKLSSYNPFSRRAFGVNAVANDGFLDIVLISKPKMQEVHKLALQIPVLGDTSGTISGKWYSGESDVAYLKVKEYILTFKPGDNTRVHINGILVNVNQHFPGGIKVECVPGAIAVYTYNAEKPRMMSKLK